MKHHTLFILLTSFMLFIPVASLKAELPRLQQSDLVHIGSFKLPTGKLGSTYGFPYAGSGGLGTGGVTYNPVRNSLFIGGHPYEQKIAEIAIPASLSGTPIATALTDLKDPLEGKLGLINPSDPNTKVIGSALVYNSKLYLGAFSYYDGGATQTKSQFSRPIDLNTTGQVVGPVKVGNNYPGWVNKYASLIPSEWQGDFGGPALTGGSGGAIVSLQSSGPSATVFNPGDADSGSNVSGTLVLGYPYGNEVASMTVGNQIWSQSDIISGMAFIAGTRTILFVGYHGLGNYCYGTGGASGGDCYDPDNGSKGVHNYPYRSQVWAYDANDLLAVKNGQKQSYQVQPYAVWELDASFKEIQGLGYDPTTQRLYVSQVSGDQVSIYDSQPLIRVYQINISSVSPPPGDTVSPSISLSSPSQGAVVSGSIVVSANASDNVGVVGVQFKLDGASLGTEDTASPYSVSWNTATVSIGSHTLTATARDAAGNTTTSSLVTVTIADTSPPIISGVSTASISINSATITWMTNESSDSQTDYGLAASYGSSTTLGASLITNHSQTLSGLAPSTLYHYRVSSKDSAGNLATSGDFTFTTASLADTAAPAVSITAPANNATVSGSSVTVSATASDNIGVIGVQFKLDGVSIGSEDIDYPYIIVWNTVGASNGSHLLTAVARDATGNVATSLAMAVVVANVVVNPIIPPAPTNLPASNTPTTYGAVDVYPPKTIADGHGYDFGAAGYFKYPVAYESVRVTLSCFDGQPASSTSGCAATLYCVGPVTCSPSATYYSDIIISTVGTSYVNYYSVDKVGNKEAIKSKIVMIEPKPVAPTPAPSNSSTNLVTPTAPTAPATLPTVPAVVAPESKIKKLQRFLNGNGYLIARSGPGSPGNETSVLGPLTKEALKKFQYDNGLSRANMFAGNLGPWTEAIIKEKYGGL